MAMWYHVVSRPCSSTKQTLNFKHFKQVSIFCFLLRHTVHMPLCLNRWGRHQNKQQNAWQAAATGIKIDCEACSYLCWWGWEGGRKMGSVSDTCWHMLLRGRREGLSKLHTRDAHSMPAAHLPEFSANISSNSHQTKGRVSEAVVRVCFTNSYKSQIKIEDIT